MPSSSLAGLPAIPKPSTYIYKTVDGLPIALDVYSKDAGRSKKPRAVFTFYHGGGLVVLNRKAVSPYQIQSALIRDWVLISVDYRLLPQVNGLEILADITAAWSFICTQLASEYNLDMTKLMVGGASAGGYLAYQSGVHFHPRPAAVMSIYGVSSFSHPFASQDLVSLGIPPLSKSDVQHFLDEPANTGEIPDAMNALLPQNSNKEGVDFDEPQEGPRDRIALSMYFIQHGLYADVVGHSKDVSPLDGMTASYPPTVIIHGTADKVVPIEASEQTVATLQSLGVTVKFIEVPGKDHAFEHFAHAKDKDGSKLWSTYLSSLYLFLDEVLALK